MNSAALIARSGKGAGVCILVVDDEFLIATMVSELLESAGRPTVAAMSASEARRLLDEHPGRYTCLVTDFNMPGETGASLIEHVRVTYPIMPIVLATAVGNAVTAAWRAQHSVELLEKPFNGLALLSAVERLMTQ